MKELEHRNIQNIKEAVMCGGVHAMETDLAGIFTDSESVFGMEKII